MLVRWRWYALLVLSRRLQSAALAGRNISIRQYTFVWAVLVRLVQEEIKSGTGYIFIC